MVDKGQQWIMLVTAHGGYMMVIHSLVLAKQLDLFVVINYDG